LEFSFLVAQTLAKMEYEEDAKGLCDWICNQIIHWPPQAYPTYRPFFQQLMKFAESRINSETRAELLRWARANKIIESSCELKLLVEDYCLKITGQSTSDAMQVLDTLFSEMQSASIEVFTKHFNDVRNATEEIEDPAVLEQVLKLGLDHVISQGFDNSSLAMHLHLDLCQLYVALGEPDLAHGCFNQAVVILNQLNAAGTNHLSGTSRTLGELAYAFGKIEQSRELLTSALHELIKEKPESQETSDILHNLGTLLVAQGELSEGQPYLEYAVSLRRKFYHKHSPELAKSLHALGKLHLLAGQHGPAMESLREAISIWQSNGSAVPDDLLEDIERIDAVKNQTIKPENTRVIELREVSIAPADLPGGLRSTKKSNAPQQGLEKSKSDPLRSALLLLQKGKSQDAIETLEGLLEEEQRNSDPTRKLLILENLLNAYENCGSESDVSRCKLLIEDLG
jgi:tetratricopeptide (TPR) repeat protein